MRLYGIVKQSREEISSRLFSWQNFFDSAVPKRQGAARFGRLPFLFLHYIRQSFINGYIFSKNAPLISFFL